MRMILVLALASAWVWLGCAAHRPTTALAPACDDEFAETYAKAALADARGEPAAAVEGYLDTLRRCADACPEPTLAIAAAMGLVAIRDRAIEVERKVEQLRTELGKRLPALPAEARFQLSNLVAGGLWRSGKRDSAKSEYRSMGCLLDWSQAGPFGPKPFLAFDSIAASWHSNPWPASFDLRAGRGVELPRAVSAQTCMVTMADPGRTRPGVHVGRATVSVDRPIEALVRLQSSSPLRLKMGEATVIERDTRDRVWPTVIWARVRLKPGVTEIIAQAVSTSGMPAAFAVSIVPTDPDLVITPGPPTALATTTVAEVSPLEDTAAGRCPQAILANLTEALFRDDFDTAANRAESLLAIGGDWQALALMGRAEVLESNPELPGEVGYETARGVYETVLEVDPKLYRARLRLTGRATDENRTRDALELLRQGLELSPNEPELHTRLLEILAEQGWRAELVDEVRALTRLLPGTCKTLAWQHYAATQLEQHGRALKLAEALTACDAQSPSFAEALEARGLWEAAMAERKRLAALSSSPVPSEASLAALEAATGHFAQARHRLAKIPDQTQRRSAETRLRLADYSLASGDLPAALDQLRLAVAQPEAVSLDLRAALSRLDGTPMLAELRVDGLEIIKRYREQAPQYDTAAVLVLDRMVYLVAPDGSSTAIVHTITQVRSDEAVESMGEVEIPSGATVLRLRTIKPDGRILEPDESAFKQTISLPDLAISDFIELEYAVTNRASDVLPGGFDTGRFFFRDFESAFHQSEIAVITPVDMKTVEDPRGDCPKVETNVRGGLRISTYRARGTTPMPEEPLAPLAREYLPSIRVLSAADWSELLADMRESLAQLDRRSLALSNAVAPILADIEPRDHKARRVAIYNWIMQNIEEEGGLFDPASHMLLRKRGSRVRLFAALCRLEGYDAQLGLIRSSLSDTTEATAPSFDLFDRLAVYIPQDGWICLDHRGAAYGFLPPSMRQRPALLVDTGQSLQTGTGVTPREERRIRMNVVLAANGDAEVEIEEKLTGLLAASWREDLREMAQQDRSRQFQDGYLADTIPGAHLVQLAIEGETDNRVPLTLSYKVRILGLAEKRGANLYAKIPFGVSLVENAAGSARRTTPLVLAMTTYKRLDLRLTSPLGFAAALVRPAEKLDIRSPFGQVKATAGDRSQTLEAAYEALLDIDRIPPGSYAEFTDFARETDRITNLEVELSPNATR